MASFVRRAGEERKNNNFGAGLLDADSLGRIGHRGHREHRGFGTDVTDLHGYGKVCAGYAGFGREMLKRAKHVRRCVPGWVSAREVPLRCSFASPVCVARRMGEGELAWLPTATAVQCELDGSAKGSHDVFLTRDDSLLFDGRTAVITRGLGKLDIP